MTTVVVNVVAIVAAASHTQSFTGFKTTKEFKASSVGFQVGVDIVK